MVIRKENQRLQVRDNVRGGNGRLENRHIIEPDAMFGSATLFTEFFFDPLFNVFRDQPFNTSA